MDSRLALTVLCSAAELFAFSRLVKVRAHRVLPWFSAYLILGFAQSFIWLAGPPRSHAYASAYGLTTPLVIGLQIAVFLEVWRKLILQYSRTDRAVQALGLAIIGASSGSWSAERSRRPRATVGLFAAIFSSGFPGLPATPPPYCALPHPCWRYGLPPSIADFPVI